MNKRVETDIELLAKIANNEESNQQNLINDSDQTGVQRAVTVSATYLTRIFGSLSKFVHAEPLLDGPLSRNAPKSLLGSLPQEVLAKSKSSDSILLKALNPYNRELQTLPVRFFYIGIIYFVLFLVSFGELEGTTWYVLVAAIGAPIAIRILLLFSERIWNNHEMYNKARGLYPMVVWLCFTFYLDILYTLLKVKVSFIGDIRKTTSIREKAGVYDERSNARFDSDGRFYFDFVADTGDGFNGTFSVASLMGRKQLEVTETFPDGSKEESILPRANLVVHGGDICYPAASFTNLFYRFIQPYSWAFPEEAAIDEKMYLAAGNHEYLDGMMGYRDILLPLERIGGWKTPQKSSYYAIKLPYNWILFVVDIGPEPEDIDDYQLNFFNSVELEDEDRVIMLYHVPDWIKCGKMGFKNMKKVQQWRRDLGERLRLVLAGDLHYYKRMEIEEMQDGISESRIPEVTSSPTNSFKTVKRQYVVSGHGGAFAHPTHLPVVERISLVEGEPKSQSQHLLCRKDYPSLIESKTLWNKKLPKMFLTTPAHIYSRVIAGLYMVCFMNIYPGTFSNGANVEDLFFGTIAGGFFYVVLAWFFVSHAIMVVSNQRVHLKNFCTVVFLIVAHTLAHIAVAFFLRFAVDVSLFAAFSEKNLEEPKWIFSYCFCANIYLYILGTILGPVVSTIYFLLAVNIFGWHYNESSGIIGVDSYRGFCRFAINPNGDIDLYSIACDRSPSDWHTAQPTNTKPAKLDSPSLEYYLLERVAIAKSDY